MATFDLIKQLRLDLVDPTNVVNLISVATPANLPTAPKHQTAYRIESTGAYVFSDLKSGATPSSYNEMDLQISDDRLAGWLDSLTYLQAKIKGLKAIISRIASKLPLVRDISGAETSEYQTLMDTFTFYKNLLAEAVAEENIDTGTAAGRYGRTHQPRIAGGNV